MSDPIAITVKKAETLALDAIVGNTRADRQTPIASATKATLPDFTNSNASSLLVSQTARTGLQWWWAFVFLPPVLWLATLVTRYRAAIMSRLPSFRSAHHRCLKSIQRATDRIEIVNALTRYIAARSGTACNNASSAVGALRLAGMYAVASEVEVFCQESERVQIAQADLQALASHRERACELLGQIEESFRTVKKSRVRPATGTQSYAPARGVPRTMALLIAATLTFAASNGSAAELPPRAEIAATGLSLTVSQQKLILQEAHDAYARASEFAATDSAEAKQLFHVSAGKYQLLVDSGIRNSELYLNLGNAYLQSSELGRAIANYERAKQLDPGNRRLLANLAFANEKVKVTTSATGDVTAPLTTIGSVMSRVRSLNQSLLHLMGRSSMIGLLVIASVLFWGVLIVRTAGFRFQLWRFAAVPLLVLLVSLGSVTLAATDQDDLGNGVIVVDSLPLHAGDGELFAEVAKLQTAQGQRVDVLATRGDWTQVRTAGGQIGWVAGKAVERIRS